MSAVKRRESAPARDRGRRGSTGRAALQSPAGGTLARCPGRASQRRVKGVSILRQRIGGEDVFGVDPGLDP